MNLLPRTFLARAATEHLGTCGVPIAPNVQKLSIAVLETQNFQGRFMLTKDEAPLLAGSARQNIRLLELSLNNLAGFIPKIPVLLLSGVLVSTGLHAAELKAAMAMTCAEVTLIVASAVKRSNKKDLKGFRWSCQLKNASLEMEGSGVVGQRDFKYNIKGDVFGKKPDDLLIKYGGSGSVGDFKFPVDGRILWPYSKKHDDYIATDVSHSMSVEGAGVPLWLEASEIVALVSVVAGGAVVGTAVTGPVAPVGLVAWASAAAAGAAGSVVGKDYIVSLSNTFWNEQESSPKAPARPSLKPNEVFKPGKDKIYISIDKVGKLVGYGPDGETEIEGKYSPHDNYVGGGGR